MPLVKKPTMTAAALAARRANARRSRGPSTPEGKDRARLGKMRHGRYSRIGPEALRLLSEHATEFASLIATLDNNSRAKIWNFAFYLLRNKQASYIERAERLQPVRPSSLLSADGA